METKTALIIRLLLIFPLALLSSCASQSNPGGLNEREVGGLTGAAVGAGTGAIIGSATGAAAAGTAIGLPIGLVAGGAIGEGMRENKEAAKQAAREEVIKQTTGGQPRVVVEGEQGYAKYNPKTGQRFPSTYTLDPITGDKLEFIK